MIEYYKNLSLESLFYINEEGLVCLEEWRDIPNYVGKYKISSIGRARSLERFQKNWSKLQHKPEIILKQSFDSHGYLKVDLSKDGIRKIFKIHLLIGMAFYNHFSDGTNKLVFDHKDNIPTHNVVGNFQVITNRNNSNKDKTTLTGFQGVSFSHKKFTCCIWWNNRSCNLGSYTTPEEASAIRKEAFDLIEQGKCIEHLVKRRNKKSS